MKKINVLVVMTAAMMIVMMIVTMYQKRDCKSPPLKVS
jgi:hypothetical protein